MNPAKLCSQLRQLTFPPEFRIEVKPGHWDREAAAAVSRALAFATDVSARLEAQAKRLAEAEALARQAGEQAAKGRQPTSLDPKFACAICNDVFRLPKNVAQLVQERGQSKELRSIERIVRNVDAVLKENGVEYIDLTGKPFDERSEDFEPAGQPQAVPGLDRAYVAACERPVVLINGKLVQRARGVVKRPA